MQKSIPHVKAKRLGQRAELIEEQRVWISFTSRFWESEKSGCEKLICCTIWSLFDHFNHIWVLNSSRQPLNGYYLGALLFFISIQRVWIVLGRCLFFKDLFAHFHGFWSQIGVVILVTPKQEVERKNEWREIFCSNFKVERKRCLNKNSLSR